MILNHSYPWSRNAQYSGRGRGLEGLGLGSGRVAASCVYTLLYQDAGVVRSAYVVNKYKNSYSKYDTDYSTCKADIG